MSADLEAIIAHQAEELARVVRENTRYREDLGTARTKLHSYERDGVREPAEGDDPYWVGVYDRIFDAWGAFALAELGTRTPSHADLVGRPELAALWEAVK